MYGPQTLPTELARFQRIDTPERLGAADRAAGCLSGVPGRGRRQPPGRPREPAGPRRGPSWSGPSPRRVAWSRRRRRSRRSSWRTPRSWVTQRAALVAAIERSVQPALQGFLALLEAYLPEAARGRASAGCRTVRPSTDTPSWPRRRWTRHPRRSMTTVWRASLHSMTSATEIARRLGFPDAAAYRAFLETDPAQSRRRPGGAGPPGRGAGGPCLRGGARAGSVGCRAPTAR